MINLFKRSKLYISTITFMGYILFYVIHPINILFGEESDPSEDCPECIADFALYDPDYEDDGVWEEETRALKTMFDTYGWSYQSVDHNDINNGVLGKDSNRKFRALIGAGGYAYYRKKAVNDTGDKNIRKFIKSGGNYVGFCAGSYWVTDTVKWAQNASVDNGTYYQSSDYNKEYDYDVNLLISKAKGPFGWTPWNDGYNATLELTAIDTNNETMAKIYMPSQTRFYYGGGPFFTSFNGEYPKKYEVWARAIAPDYVPDGSTAGDGKPTIIRFKYEKGNVILFAYHPALLIDSFVDHVVLNDYINENTWEWYTGNQTQDEINFYCWNIVHAALQIAAEEEVTPLTSLP